VFPQNLGLKQHLQKSGSIKIDGKHFMLVVPDFLIRVGKGGFFRRAARFELKTQIDQFSSNKGQRPIFVKFSN
jgi:hypothetical protein